MIPHPHRILAFMDIDSTGLSHRNVCDIMSHACPNKLEILSCIFIYIY